METNILKAIKNIVENPITELKDYYQTRNRANSMGGALEEYIKDIFANTVNEVDERNRLEILENQFSYLGNQNNPPDIIIREGDAIEVKKIESKIASLALNSSYPKSKLYSNSSMITEECRRCESWSEKDILYIVGVVPKEKGAEGKHLATLSMVYGVDYAASADVYERIKNVISNGITSINDVELSQTNELGRVNRVDPLGITYLRIRGMWGIENPLRTFKYVYHSNPDSQFNFMAIISLDKYFSFSDAERFSFEKLSKENINLEIKDIKIKNPNNPVQLREAKLITFFK